MPLTGFGMDTQGGGVALTKMLRTSGFQTFTGDDTSQRIDWGAAPIDTLGAANVANNEFVVPAAGVYEVHVTVTWATTEDQGRYELGCVSDTTGSWSPLIAHRSHWSTTNAEDESVSLTWLGSLSAGDVVAPTLHQNSGADVPIDDDDELQYAYMKQLG